MTPKTRVIARRISISVSLVALVVAFALYIVQKQFNLAVQIGLGIFIIGLAVYVALDPSSIRAAFSGRQAKYGSNALLLVIAFAGILVVINYLAYKNTKQWDLTADQSNTLAKETVDVLKNVPETIVAKAFFSSSSDVSYAKDDAKTLLEKYVYAGNGKFKYEFIDPNKDPAAAQEAGITADGEIVVTMGDQKQTVSSSTESDLTGAIVRLMNPGAHMVYFLTGHGEFPIEGGADTSYSQLKTTLEERNYRVATLNLLTTNQIPQDGSVIVVAGPDKPLADVEVRLIDDYIKSGGSLVVMTNPAIITNFGTETDPLAEYLSQSYGINLGNDVVIDVTGNQVYQNAYFVIGTPSGNHAITEPINSLVVGFNYARSVSDDESKGTDFNKTQLVFTADQSWAETDIASLQDGTAKMDQDVDIVGPVPLAVAAQGSSNDARLVVFGNSDFATNAGFGWYGNGDLIVNSIDWSAKVENLISLTPKQPVTRTLVQPQGFTMGLILLASLFLLPGVVVVAGVSSWLIRRKQG
jgi:ABC-type uncharacterized transport system involved in gliding motility auxiliary subunit